MPLFLFNFTERCLYGVFEATQHGCSTVDNRAFRSRGQRNSPFPAQVPVRYK